MGGNTDEQLMEHIAQGDEAAFRLLAARYLVRAVGLARRITGNAADAEEIAQEAMLRIWSHAPRWRPSAAFGTWFYRVVVNLCLNHRRRIAFVAIGDAGDPPDGRPDALAELVDVETERRVAAAVAALPERQRAAIVLTYHEGLSNAETAAVLGTSVSGVETLLVRARRTLRTMLGED